MRTLLSLQPAVKREKYYSIHKSDRQEVLTGKHIIVRPTNRMDEKNSRLVGMGSGVIREIVVARIKVNVDLLDAINEIVREKQISKGVIISGVGALKKAVFRNVKEFVDLFPVKPENRLYYELEQPLELVSLTGHIAPRSDGTADIHAHFSASTAMNDKVITLGGHLMNGAITWIKVAVAIAVLDDAPMVSTMDDSTKSFDLSFEVE